MIRWNDLTESTEEIIDTVHLMLHGIISMNEYSLKDMDVPMLMFVPLILRRTAKLIVE